MGLEKDTAIKENSTVIVWASFPKETELNFFVSLPCHDTCNGLGKGWDSRSCPNQLFSIWMFLIACKCEGKHILFEIPPDGSDLYFFLTQPCQCSAKWCVKLAKIFKRSSAVPVLITFIARSILISPCLSEMKSPPSWLLLTCNSSKFWIHWISTTQNLCRCQQWHFRFKQ